MAKVPRYTQDKLASSIRPVVIDDSAAQLTARLNKNINTISDATFNLVAKKQKEVDEINERVKNVNDTLTAYNRSIAIENEMYDIIEEEKTNNIGNPQLALKNVENRGRELITQRMSELDDSTDISVKEKMAGIVTNSFRGKLSEMRSWQMAQDTANAQNKIEEMTSNLCTRASKTGSLQALGECLNFDNLLFESAGNVKENAPLSKAIELAYGAKAGSVIQKAKTEIAQSYCLGLFDRKSPNQVTAVVNSGALDEYLDPKDKHTLLNMAKTMAEAQVSAAKRDSFLEIYGIKENAALLSSQGEYTPSMYARDKKRLTQLGAKATDYNMILAKSLSSDKLSDKMNFAENQKAAHNKVTKAWADIAGKKGNIKADTELENIIKFQDLMEENRQYFTNEQYDAYMLKLTKSRTKRIKDMKTGIFGQPQGTLKGDDEYSKGYNQIYNYAKQNYKDDKKRLDAIDNMTVEFVKQAERTENQTGKPLTEGQAQSILKGVMNRQAQRTNPYLQNIPKNGQLFKDKTTGRVYKLYPDGRREVVQ